MSNSREMRQSEKTFQDIFVLMPKLAICIWREALVPDAIELIGLVRNQLNKLEEELIKEKKK